MASPGTHLFVYGSLTDPRTLDAVLGHAHGGERFRARLDGFERVQVAAYAYPFLVPLPDRSVDGLLVMDLIAADLAALDVYEGLERGMYVRRAVDVECWGCGPHPLRLAAQTYVGGAELTDLIGALGAQPAPSRAT